MTSPRGQVLQHRPRRVERVLQGDEAVGLREACRRIGISYGYGRRLSMEGRFPIPSLPRLSKRGHFRFSPIIIREYLADASMHDAQVAGRR